MKVLQQLMLAKVSVKKSKRFALEPNLVVVEIQIR